MSDRPALPKLEDVARRAGVSTATVSRCLNTPDKVSAITRERVMQAVEQLGYSPNFGARAMAARRTMTIGAVIPTMENAIFGRGLQAFQEALRLRGYTLLVSSSSYQPELEEEQVRALLARGADGFLLIGHDRAPRITELLRGRGVPALVAWAYDRTAPLTSVGFDNYAAMAAMTDVVIQKGHRRIATISVPTTGNDRARARVAAIRDRCVRAALPAPQLIEVPYGIEAAQEAFARLMQSTPRPTVVICGNDVLAAGALRQAAGMGLRVPVDVSVTGFDDIELARLVTPALTTVHVPHREMGRRAADLLVDMVEGRTPDASVELSTEISLRDSLGAPSPALG